MTSHSPQAEAAAIAKSVTLPLPIIAAAGKGEQWAIEEYGAACVLAGMKREADRVALAPWLTGEAGHSYDIMQSRNLGYYRTEVTCECGDVLWWGQHDGDPTWREVWVGHLLDALFASGVIREASPSDADTKEDR